MNAPCAKCGGLMAGFAIFDHEATDTDSCANTMRCMLCGRISDPVTERNRASPLPDLRNKGNRLLMNPFRKREANKSRRKRKGAEE